ncbi:MULTISPECIES: hypothetical protein [unclassified Pseudoalteromonas]|uniref:hypothetical protein n=1 Tax=unclassified Pseudoalteromonas TaxID=194690 RepID=UPI000693EAC8|nr:MULTISPECIES: hypothetical protein [unclassified Pseudoalteromonas]
MSSQYEAVIKNTKKIETLLQLKLSAQGRGLHQKVSNVETLLPPSMVRDVRKIATLRNKLIHEDAFSIPNLSGFVQDCTKVIGYLENLDVNAQENNSNKSSLISLSKFVFIVGTSIIVAINTHPHYLMGTAGILWVLTAIISWLLSPKTTSHDQTELEEKYATFHPSHSDLSNDNENNQNGSSTQTGINEEQTLINPATGLPMLNGSAVDTAGNPFGVDYSDMAEAQLDYDNLDTNNIDFDSSFDNDISSTDFDSDITTNDSFN